MYLSFILDYGNYIIAVYLKGYGIDKKAFKWRLSPVLVGFPIKTEITLNSKKSADDFVIR